MAETTTPEELARELSVSAKTIRAWLRTEYPRGAEHDQPWRLDQDQASAVRARFQN
jgi:hypothetical protein